MNLYLLTQYENNGYDTYDSMVISAENERDALMLSYVRSYDLQDYEPEMEYGKAEPIWREYYLSTSYFAFRSWAEKPNIKLIANNTTESEGIVCSSFNAG